MRVQRRVIAVAAGAAIALGLMPGAASAQVRVESQQLPFYARIVTGTGEEWTAVYFYRPVDCIPESFNLLRFQDPPRVFGCGPMTVEGFAIWETGPGLDPGPIQSRYRGLGAVPIWFLPTEDYLAATADGVLTIGELEALDPLLGEARLFGQIQHVSPPAENGLLHANATGTLQDGRSFRLHWTHQAAKGHDVIHVEFRD
jgi:hypothetical protein